LFSLTIWTAIILTIIASFSTDVFDDLIRQVRKQTLKAGTNPSWLKNSVRTKQVLTTKISQNRVPFLIAGEGVKYHNFTDVPKPSSGMWYCKTWPQVLLWPQVLPSQIRQGQ